MNLEFTACNLCGTVNRRACLSDEDSRYVRCGTCGLVYQNPRYTFDHLKKKVYVNKYFHYELRNQDNFFNLMTLNLRDFRFAAVIGENGKGRRFLDIGSATGLLLKHMKDLGWKTEGIELCRDSAEYARRKFGLKINRMTLEERAFPAGSFDVVHMSHIIEHVPDPSATLNEVFRVLKSGGHLMIVTPCIESFQAMIFRSRWRSAHRDHLTLFSTATLGRYLRKAGFRILKQFSYGGLGIEKTEKNRLLRFVKPAVDRAVKILNWGDVTAFLCRKG
jgi:2-polyprenyl-3-methyl-5-hydroxy-6-metoxy-1,4-benzoquinol methylase